MGNFQKNIISFILLLYFLGVGSSARAGQNLALLLDNGDLKSISPDGSVITFPLYCEGKILCGSVIFNTIQTPQFDEQRIEIIFDVQVCQCPSCPDPLSDPFCQTCLNPSCVTSRNSIFDDDAIPQIIQPDGTVYASAMTQHDPISCSDVSGIFATEGCAGNLNLDYRCLVVFDVPAQKIVRTFSGSFIISTTGQ